MTDAPSPKIKALAVARLEAMKGALVYDRMTGSLEGPVSLWTCSVRSNGGSIFKRSGEDVVETIDRVHADWIPCHAEERRNIVARAARFNVAEVAPTEDTFTGIHEVPPGKTAVYAHFYDTLVTLRGEHPRLVYKKMTPMEWQLEVKAGTVIRGPNLKKLCNRLDAFMHKHFLDQREEILRAAKEAGLLEKLREDGEDEDVGEQPEKPVVVAPSRPSEQEGAEPRMLPLFWALVSCAITLLAGILIGMMVG